MKIKLSLVLFCFSFPLFVLGQQISITGKITNNFDVEGIHILNQTSKYNAVTNQFGEFSIRAQLRDTLLISSVNFELQQFVISEEVMTLRTIKITLIEIINELDEVLIGNTLTGNFAYDIKNINTEKDIDFDDVGIPGFKGIPQERIVHPVEAFFPTNVNIEAVYKYISGYYKKLKIKRKWTSENTVVVEIINYYGLPFFEDAYRLPQDRVYDFMLFCIETSTIQSDFKRQNFAGVLTIFQTNSEIYISRISDKSE